MEESLEVAITSIAITSRIVYKVFRQEVEIILLGHQAQISKEYFLIQYNQLLSIIKANFLKHITNQRNESQSKDINKII